MLLSVTGASGSGKSTILAGIAGRLDAAAVRCAEFDSIGVPPGADTAWRHAATERWVQEAIAEGSRGRHLVLFGQAPVGELLAAPSAARLDGIAACLLHCSPAGRRARLLARGLDDDELADHLGFGGWFHGHMRDPTHQPDVIRVPSAIPMRWERWSDWPAGDRRWSFPVIETDVLTPEQTTDRVLAWITGVIAGEVPAIRPVH